MRKRCVCFNIDTLDIDFEKINVAPIVDLNIEDNTCECDITEE